MTSNRESFNPYPTNRHYLKSSRQKVVNKWKNKWKGRNNYKEWPSSAGRKFSKTAAAFENSNHPQCSDLEKNVVFAPFSEEQITEVVSEENIENKGDGSKKQGQEIVPESDLPPSAEVSSSRQGPEEDCNLEEEAGCREESVDAFICGSLISLEQFDYQVDRALRVMIDMLHPDARAMLDLLGLNSSDFYRLCSFYSNFEFHSLNDLALEKCDVKLVEILLEQLVWICRSFVVGMLAKRALLAEELIDFARLDLDLSLLEGLDEYKEIDFLLSVAEDLRNVPGVHCMDTAGWFSQCQVLKDTVDAFNENNRQKLKELGVVDTAERVSERIILGMDVSAEEITNLLLDSVNSGFGEYTWLLENHPQLISTVEHFECILDSIPAMSKYVDIRPLRCSLNIIPRVLSLFSVDERDRCVAKQMTRHQLPEVCSSWLHLIRNAENVKDLSLKLTTQFFFCSIKCGAEELLGALLENIPIEKKIMAIESIEHMPQPLHVALLPVKSCSNDGGLYTAIQRMTEEMRTARFKKDAVFLLEMLCKWCSLSPSRLFSEVFFPLMSTSAKGKSAIAISSLMAHEVFRKEISTGSTTVTVDSLVSFALEQYEPPVSTSYTSKFLFIEAVLRGVNAVLREDRSLKLNITEVFSNAKNILWYQMFVIVNLFFDADIVSGALIEYPWNKQRSSNYAVETLSEIPLILTSWPGDNSSLLEKFITENFEKESSDVLSRSMLIVFDRGVEQFNMHDFLHVFARVIYTLRHEDRDWERFLLEEELKYQDIPHAQVFDITGISFGFFDEDDNDNNDTDLNLGKGGQLPDDTEILENTAPLLVNSSSFFYVDAQSCSDCEFSSTAELSSVFVDGSSVGVHSLEDRFSNKNESYATTGSKNRLKEGCSCSGLTKIADTILFFSNEKDRVTVTHNAGNEEESVAALLEEMCKKVSDCCAGSIRTEIIEIKNNMRIMVNTSTPTQKEDSSFVREAVPVEFCNRSHNFKRPIPGMETAEAFDSFKLKQETNTAHLSEGEDLPLVQQSNSDLILSDLRTFTWALDTIEEWEDCPTSVRTKILASACESHCDVIKIRARRLKESYVGS